ncbi:hypothetical protein [Endozoicomonas sp. ONNA2]|uniref:hypothetical protein n=1 Tax=Endozoicomonas sp. ONNA2 TaxID=2828741 RepID=UPI002148B858|nr:hypothetical protein [Endozoicomonas sp. ONNA2]
MNAQQQLPASPDQALIIDTQDSQEAKGRPYFLGRYGGALIFFNLAEQENQPISKKICGKQEAVTNLNPDRNGKMTHPVPHSGCFCERLARKKMGQF